MAISKEKKGKIIETLRARLADAPTWVFVHWRGLKEASVTEIRKALRAQSVGFAVVKKTLLGKALESQAFKGERPELAGEIAVAYGDGVAESLAPARAIHAFAEKLKENLQIVGGIFEGSYLGAAAMAELGGIPSREVLLGRLATMAKWPLQRLAMTVGAIAKSKS